MSLNRNKKTVVRPVAVNPEMYPPSVLKCSVQACRRGLNRDVMAPVKGSMLVKSEPLCRLQGKQARTKFSAVVCPPCLSAIM